MHFFAESFFFQLSYFIFKVFVTKKISLTDLEEFLKFSNNSSLKCEVIPTPHQDAFKYLSKIQKSGSCVFSKYYLWSVSYQKLKIFNWVDFFMMFQCEEVKRWFLSIFSWFSYDLRHKIDFMWFQNVIWVIQPSVNAVST